MLAAMSPIVAAIKVINGQDSTGREITWKVLTDTLRRLEAEGYVARRQVPAVPRQTWYWLRPAGHRLVCALTVLDNWLTSHHPQDATITTGPAGGQDPGAPLSRDSGI
jgi:DNA-binding HxlR family transcriptional regulator